MILVAKHLTISGHVQGVWYRGWTVKTARCLGLTGWVRNRSDGTVEAVIQGMETAIGTFLVLAHEGPPAARVKAMDIHDEPISDMRDFEARPTV